MVAIEAVLSIATAVLLLPMGLLLVECLAALLPGRRSQPAVLSPRPRIGVLIPAHDEEAVIDRNIRRLRSQLRPEDVLLVVADNCADSTAELARKAGAEVVERTDPIHRGKGYALDFGLQAMQGSPPEVVVVVDADCTVEEGSLEALACRAMATGRPVQAVDLVVAVETRPESALSAFSFLVKNLVRPLGLHRLGVPCLARGTGMAFPWAVLKDVCLASGSIVEDLQMGVDMTLMGHSMAFCPEARVTSPIPSSPAAARKQRTRWEHGHLQTLMGQVPRMLKEAVRRRDFRLLALGLDQAVPPLTFLVFIWLALLAASGCLALVRGPGLSLDIAIVEGAMLLLAIAIAWIRFGRAVLPLSAIISIPIYMLWKIPIYFSFLHRREKEWVRTERDVPSAERRPEKTPSC